MEFHQLLKKHPQAIGIRFGIRSYGTEPFQVKLILPSATAASEIDHELTYSETSATVDGDLLDEILAEPRWQVLVVHLEQRDPLIQRLLDNLHRFKHLRRLEYKHPFQMRDGKISLDGLPKLEMVNLHEVEILVSEPLTHVHTFWLDSFQKIDVAPILAVLNPEVFQKLDLRHAELTEFPADLQRFKKLNQLGLTGNKIASLQGIETLTQLTHLNLNNNQLKHLPIELFSLTQLEELSLNQNPITSDTEIKGKTVVLKLMHWCEAHQFPIPLRQFFVNLIQETLTDASDNDIPGLVWALASDVELLRRKAMNRLAETVPDSLRQGFDATRDTISIIGKIKGLTAKDILTQLKKHSIKASDKLKDDTTIVCLGESVTMEQAEAVIRKNPQLIVPQHLKEFLEQLETPYLKESDEEMQRNLSRLIRSEEESNLKIAVQMIMTGGMPEGLFYQVLWLGMRKGSVHWKPFRTLLEKYATPQQYDFIKKYRQKEFADVIEELLGASVFDQPALIKAGIQIFHTPLEVRSKSYPSNRTNYYAFRDIFRKGLRQGGDTARYLYQTMLQDTTIDLLFSAATVSDKFQFAKELLELEQVEKVICSHVCAIMPSNTKLLNKMKSLKELELYKQSNVSVDLPAMAEVFPALKVTVKNYK